MNTRFDKDQLSANHYNLKWKETIKLMPQGGDYCFYMRQYGYDIIKAQIRKLDRIFDYACGLGVIDEQLDNEGAYVYGCDISKVAVNYVKGQIYDGHEHPDSFQVTDKIFPMPDEKDLKYQWILAIYFLEHIPDPARWMENALNYGQRVIFSIPNNFKRAGEHVLMAWHDWDSFYDLFDNYTLTRIDEGKYHDYLPPCYHHPTFICEKK